MTREHITDAHGHVVRVGDRIAAAVSSWNGPNLMTGTVERITASRTVVAVESHTAPFFNERTSAIDDSRKRFVKLEAAA